MCIFASNYYFKLFRSYSLSGAYRHIVKKPDNVAWKCVQYSDPFADLILSDLDELRRKEPIKDLSGNIFLEATDV